MTASVGQAGALLEQLNDDPAQGLRATAALIRDRADEASANADGSPEVWFFEPDPTDDTLGVVATLMLGDDGKRVAGEVSDPTERDTAIHIAGFDPATAVALAALLDAAADEIDHRAQRTDLPPRVVVKQMTVTGALFLRLARTYLGAVS